MFVQWPRRRMAMQNCRCTHHPDNEIVGGVLLVPPSPIQFATQGRIRQEICDIYLLNRSASHRRISNEETTPRSRLAPRGKSDLSPTKITVVTGHLSFDSLPPFLVEMSNEQMSTNVIRLYQHHHHRKWQSHLKRSSRLTIL